MNWECVTTADLLHKRWRVDGPVMVLPYIDSALAQRAAELAARRASANGLILVVEDSQHEGFIASVNLAFRATHSPWFGYMAQDAFAGRDWMALALQALHKQRGVLLAFNDGKWHGALASFGLASRAWASTNYKDANFFYPGYKRHYADTELTLLANQVKGFVYQPDSVLMEVDWDKDQARVDAVDKLLFKKREAQGFGGKLQDKSLMGLFS